MNNATPLNKTQQTKAELAKLSDAMRLAASLGQLGEDFTGDTSANILLRVHYFARTSNFPILKTFKQWHDEGRKVKKGAKAYIFWSSPQVGTYKEVKTNEANEQHETEKNYKFWGLCYLFTEEQVE